MNEYSGLISFRIDWFDLLAVRTFQVAQLLQCRRPRFDSWVGEICWRSDRLPTPVFLDFPGGSAGEKSACNVEDLGSIPGLGRSLGEGNSYLSSILAWRIPWTV